MAFPRGKKLWMERNQGQNRESQHREKVHEVPHKRQFQLKRHESSLGSFHRKEGSCVKAVGCFSQPLCASKAPICRPQSGTIYMMVRMAFPHVIVGTIHFSLKLVSSGWSTDANTGARNRVS